MRSILELRHLRTLVALRATGSLSKAATLLNLTQSALSHQIKAIEDHYGMALFERKSSPLAFTVPGQRLLALADQVLPQIDEAERDVARLGEGMAGQLRIAVECHTCFDWLMPAMDMFRTRWPEVELDIVSGFHSDPVGLLHQHRAELAIVSDFSQQEQEAGIAYLPLFSYEMVALVANGHALTQRTFLRPQDFADQTLITYPVPDEMLDLMRQVLTPAGISPQRRTSELTVAILQLVASGRGVAALPLWAVKEYLDRGYVSALPITRKGLTGKLYAACAEHYAERPFVRDFTDIIRDSSLLNLPGIALLPVDPAA
jgi:LysR family transcriptional regulator, regulator for metE and metH